MTKLTVLYNDQCPVCSLEIEHYRGLSIRHAPHLEFEPLSEPGAVYQALGLTQEAARQRLHVLDSAGALHIGVDAFLVIWRALPGYRQLARVVAWRPIYVVARAVYNGILAPLLYAWDRRRSAKGR